MSDEPIARKAMREAERGSRADVSLIVASVPELMREAMRRQAAATASPALESLAFWALPRLAAATAVAVLAAMWLGYWERGSETTGSTTFESVVVGGDGDATDDAVIDALLDLEGNDG